MSSRPTRYLVVLLAVAMLLAGCGRSSQDESPAAQVTAAVEAKEDVVNALSLAGTSWQLEFIGEPSDDMPVLPDTRPTVSYGVDRYGGTGGCNYYVGVYTVDTSSLRMNTPATTMAVCTPEDVASQEGTFMSALVNTTEYKMEGENLVAYTVGEQRMLTFSPADPVPFEGTTWQLQFAWDESYWAPTILGSAVTGVFEGEQMTGSGGCNNYVAAVTIAGSRMTIDPAASTMTTCTEPEGVMEQENAYFTVLETVAGYEQLGGLLLLLNSEGEAILAYGAKVE